MPSRFASFLSVFPADGAPRRLVDLRPELRQHVPELLIEFWREVGIGSFGDGFLHFVDPDAYADTLGQWLMSDGPRPDRIPFARTAFGDLLYFRDLREPSPDGGATAPSLEDAGDISFLSVHYSRGEMVSYSTAQFFDGALAAFVEHSDLPLRALYRQLREKQAAPDENTCYFFAPALRLGGSADVKHLAHGDCLVHLDLLYQLATG